MKAFGEEYEKIDEMMKEHHNERNIMMNKMS
jgi:hypothetical protein